MFVQAIKEKNFEKFSEITMRDSNQFHAICLDTYPPCVYLNQVSHEIMSFVHDYNEAAGQIKVRIFSQHFIKLLMFYCYNVQVSYTFDAGPNAFLFIQQKDLDVFISELIEVFPSDQPESSYVRGIVLNPSIVSKLIRFFHLKMFSYILIISFFR